MLDARGFRVPCLLFTVRKQFICLNNCNGSYHYRTKHKFVLIAYLQMSIIYGDAKNLLHLRRKPLNIVLGSSVRFITIDSTHSFSLAKSYDNII